MLKKRSVNLKGHATSVARARGVSLAALIAQLDETRGDSLLASHCRCTALDYALNPPRRKRAA